MSGANPYDVLGIAREAAPDEVRAAYFRLVREHTPEDAPERFQEIAAAYRVLSDPEARRRLDVDLGVPPDVEEALREASDLLDKDPPAAARRALRALEVPGRSAEVRFAVAATCLRAGAAASALPLLEALVREDPGAGPRQHALGEAYAATNRPKQAEAAFRRAIAAAPDQRAPYAALAELLEATGRRDEALRTLRVGRRATNPSGAPDPRDLEILFPEFIVHARAGRTAETRRVLADVRRTVPPDDPAAAQHVGVQVAILADRFAGARHYDVAHVLMREAHAIAPIDAIRERMTELERISKQHRAALSALEDPAIAKWIRDLIALRVGKTLPEAEFRGALDAIAGRLAERTRLADQEWTKFEMRYAAAAEYVKDLRDAVVDGARRAAAAPREERTVAGMRRRPSSVRRTRSLGVVALTALALLIACVMGLTFRSGNRSSPRGTPASPSGPAGAAHALPRVSPAGEAALEAAMQRLSDAVRARLRRELGREPTPTEVSEQLNRYGELVPDVWLRGDPSRPEARPRTGTR